MRDQSPESLYEPLDFTVVRAPLLPADTMDRFRDDPSRALSRTVRAALAAGSLVFSDALTKNGSGVPAATVPALRRYLVRMSRRPTPLGLFAGVGLAEFGDHTTLTIARGRRPQRTRPDASWLMAIVDRAEADPDIRSQSRLTANPAAFIRAGRVFLTERIARSDDAAPLSVSIRATAVVRAALAEARTPIPYEELAALLLDRTPGATAEQVRGLLDELCRQTLLMTDLRPPLTVSCPARYTLDRLEAIPAAGKHREALASVLEAAAEWDGEPEPGEAGFRNAVAIARDVMPTENSPFQVDSALAFSSRTVSRVVADEAARAAEILLRVSPASRGTSHLDSYRRLFEARYGRHRDVALLEMLDPNFGVGPLPSRSSGGAGSHRPLHSRTRLKLAIDALRERTRCVVLDSETLGHLGADSVSPADIPVSLELTVVIAARSRAAVDAGDFLLTIGPSIGSNAAGRMLGRFADFVGGADAALAQIASIEQERMPGRIVAELVYAPRSARLANVSTRTHPRPYEIAVGVTPGVKPSRTIPVDELVVGVDGGRFSLKWGTTGEEVVITAGHMLNPAGAPPVCRFLSEVGRDGVRQLSGFSWGPASSFPFLPRLRYGRIVLSPAQWRLQRDEFDGKVFDDPCAFGGAVDDWRAKWDAPGRLAIAANDRILPLDLTQPADTEELRRTLGRGNGSTVLTEVFPEPADMWLSDDSDGRFAAEFVVPLIRRTPIPAPGTTPTTRTCDVELRTPGSDWLFVKLYVGHDMEEDLLRGPIRELTRELADVDFTEWFFIRYTDTGPHVRLRFHGDPARLVAELLPRILYWATGLTTSGACLRYAIDTYERETARFGGPGAMSVAEDLFTADSGAVLDLLSLDMSGQLLPEPLPIAALTVDALLSGLGLPAGERAEWYAMRAGSRRESGQDYRRWKATLRPLLADSHPFPPLDAVLCRLT